MRRPFVSYDADMVGCRRLAALLCGLVLLTAGCLGSEEAEEKRKPGTIVVASTVGRADKHDELYAVAVRTGARRNLTRTPGRSEILPSLSPDGRRIAFYASNPEELQVLDLRTRRRVRWASGADLVFNVPQAPPSWSPDGGRIAFGVTTGCDAFEECGKAEIWVVSANGGRPVRVARDGRVPSWSPDGGRLAWWDNIGLEGVGSRAMVWDARTGRRRIVGRSDAPPAWLPDGTLLAGERVLDLASGLSRRARPADYGSRSPDGSHVAVDDTFLTGEVSVMRVAGGGSYRLRGLAAHAWSLDGRRLAFLKYGLSERDSRMRVSILNADGSRRRVLRREHRLFEMRSPLLWTAGNLLVFGGQQRGQDTELLALSPERRRREQLTRNDVSEFEPSVSRDGGQIAFVRGEHEQIWSMRRDGSGARPLVGNPELRAFSPAWSPDDDELVFVRSDTRGLNEEGSPPDLFVMRSDGSSVRRLTRDAWATDPAWSPGGERIAYSRSQRHCRALWLIAPDGEDDERLTDCDFYAAAPAWAPDGKELAFLGRPVAELDFGRFLHLYVIDWDDPGDPRLVARDVQMLQGSGVARYEPEYEPPSWSPDGRRLVYSRKRGYTSLGLYVVDADDGRPVRLARGGHDPFWAVLPG